MDEFAVNTSEMRAPLHQKRILRILTVSVSIVAGLVLIFALQLARPLLVPIIVGTLLSYILDPLVAILVARKIPRGIAASLVMMVVVLTLMLTMYSMRHDAGAFVARLPVAAQELRETIQTEMGDTPSPVAQMQRAADELRQMSTPTSPAPSPTEVRKVEIVATSFDVGDYLLSSSTNVFGVIADGIVVIFLAFYLLLVGDLFRRRLIEIAGPTLTNKKITLQILDDISHQISVYLFVRSLISAIVAISTGLALWAVGLTQPAVWGIVAGMLNIVPYVGPITVAGAIGLAAFLQFHSLSMVGMVVGITVLIALIEAYAITPWLTSRAAEMNPVAVFIGLVFWGWLWGLPGLLLAIPLMMIFRAVAEHVEALQPVLALLKG